jgi:hypothetical protein
MLEILGTVGVLRSSSRGVLRVAQVLTIPLPFVYDTFNSFIASGDV